MADDVNLARFRSAVLNYRPGEECNAPLLIAESGSLQTFYSPFEYLNPRARVVFVGITPGRQQAANALERARQGLIAGEPETDVLKAAKQFASFSGSMRKNLVDCLDHIGLAAWLGVSSTADLFADRSELAHFTSVLRYPTFFNDDNYRGQPPILKSPFLKAMAERWFGEELALLNRATFIPLGPTPTEVLDHFAAAGLVDSHRILAGLPHPSGANAERIAYFLGRKSREALSAKTSPAQLDSSRERLKLQVSALGTAEPNTNMTQPLQTDLARPSSTPTAPHLPSGGKDYWVPVARDGSWFGPHLASRSGFTIGQKGAEIHVSDFETALRRLQSMSPPRWRRPNASGNWGIVSAIRWARISEFD